MVKAIKLGLLIAIGSMGSAGASSIEEKSVLSTNVPNVHFTVVRCPRDREFSPTIRIWDEADQKAFRRSTPDPMKWNVNKAGLLEGSIYAEPGWKMALIETPHCYAGPISIGILPGHSRHILAVVSNHQFPLIDYGILVAGELPMPGLTVSVRDSVRSYQATIDDGAYYCNVVFSKGPLELLLGLHTTSGVSLGRTAAAVPQYTVLRRDITDLDLYDLLGDEK